MNRDEQLHVLRSEAHRLLDAMLETNGRYYGNENVDDKARQLDAFSDLRSAFGCVVDAYGIAVGYPDAWTPAQALTDEIESQQRIGGRDTVVSILEDVAARIVPPATDNHVAV